MGLFGLFKRTRAPSRPAEGLAPRLPNLPAAVEATPEPAAPLPPPPPAPVELRRMLFDAVATGDGEKLAHLCREHRELLQEYANTWSSLPDSLNANPEAARWYGEGLRAIAQFCAERPEPRGLQEPPASGEGDAEGLGRVQTPDVPAA